MSLRHLLERFETHELTGSKKAARPSDDNIESVRSAAYEAGYASGWEDAKAAEDQSRIRVQAEFERNVEALSFTHNEAMDSVRAELKVFLDALLNELLPAALPDFVRAHLRSELLLVSDAQLDSPVEIVASPDCTRLVADLVENELPAGIELVEDAGLSTYQIYVRIADVEREINLDPLISDLRVQLNAMTETESKAIAHG